MALYVTRPNVPGPGADWSTAVPGQYLYNVTGVAATLTTQPGTATVAADASGNARPGTYHLTIPPQRFVAGIVPGDTALQTGFTIGSGNTHVDLPYGTLDWTNPWSLTWWAAQSPSGDPADFVYVSTDGSTHVVVGVEVARPGGDLNVDASAIGTAWATATGVVPLDGSGHFWALTWNGTTLVLYRDGAVIPWATTGTPGPVLTIPTVARIAGALIGGGTYTGIIDEVAPFAGVALSAGQVSTLYVAGLVGIANYSAAVLALTPFAYYHLDDGASTGRQVVLEITDGTTVVEAIPSGLAELNAAGPFFYSWQPKLAASSENAPAGLITVAIPPLILPAGYTIGVRTLDLFALDRWSDVTVWWDDNIQQALTPYNPYAYPPGARLVYRQETSTP